MEVLKDYPKEFVKTFRPSFNLLYSVNIKFFCENESIFNKYGAFAFIIPCIVINYVSFLVYLSTLILRGEIFKVAYMLPVFFVCTQAYLKTIVLFPNTEKITFLIKELGMLWKENGLNEEQEKQRNNLMRKFNFCNGATHISLFPVIYQYSGLGTVQYIITPLLETLTRKFILGQDCELLLPMDCSYPFDPTGNWLIYCLVYAFQAYNLVLAVCLYLGTEFIMQTVCAHLGNAFELLCEDLRQVQLDTNKICTVRFNNEVYQPITIKEFVKRHQKLIFLSSILNAVCNKAIFIDIFFVGITTCCFSYAGQFSRGPTYMVNNYVAVMTSLFYVFCLCYNGESLTRVSSSVGDIAYQLEWYKGNKEFKKIILFIIMRSHYPCCLTSMNYTKVTLNLFTKVMSTTWSYFSLMNSVYEEEYTESPQ